MEPRQFREPEPEKAQPVAPGASQTTFTANNVSDLGSGPWSRIFRPAEKPTITSGIVPMNAVRPADWAGTMARITNEDVKYHVDI